MFKVVHTVITFTLFFFMTTAFAYGQSPSFETYLNPIIPGDHPDPTLTKIGNYFYTSGSSFNPTPKIYRSTDLVHWEVIAQPVAASWTQYGDNPGGGIWGGHTVLYKGTYWHYFGKGGGAMYFVTADQPEGPWSAPVRVTVPAGMPAGLGVDNSIFIDDDTSKWYMLTKAGQPNNHIVELGDNGQPTGTVLNLTWLNPNSAGNPYGWAEGPVMWKHNGYYYYSFAQHLVGSQYAMRSETLTADKSAWTVVGTNMFTGARGSYGTPNHISPAVTLDDGTSWVVAHSYHSTWYAQGRQGLLCQVTYNAQGFPVAQFPSNNEVPAPNLPSGGIPWMVPKSDMFTEAKLKPDWSFLGYTPDRTWSLAQRPGWLYLEPYGGSNTVIQNDGEHNYTLITRVDFTPEVTTDEAGLWIMNGPQTHHAQVYSTVTGEGKNVLALRFQDTVYEAENTVGAIVWLKLVRSEHRVLGFYSADGIAWTQIGEPINAAAMDVEQSQFNDFTGNQQGLYVKGKAAYFDLYIYRDAYSDIAATSPANRFGVSATTTYLGGIQNNDWALYAGVEFGDETPPAGDGLDYQKSPKQVGFLASSQTTGGLVEVWLDSIDTGRKIAEVAITNTGDWNTYTSFNSPIDKVTGRHDVYLRFKGVENEQLFRLKSFVFIAEQTSAIGDNGSHTGQPDSYALMQNYPNPFNPSTRIKFAIPHKSLVSLQIYDLLGKKMAELAGQEYAAGQHSIMFDASHLPNGIYLYTFKAGDYVSTRKMVFVK